MTETGNLRGPFTADEHHLLKTVKRHLWGLSKRGHIEVYTAGKKTGKIQKWVRITQNGKVAYQDGGLKQIGDPVKTFKVVMLSVSDFRRVVKAINREMTESVDSTTGKMTPVSEGYLLRLLGRMSALIYTTNGEWRWPDGYLVLLGAKFGQEGSLSNRKLSTPAARLDEHFKRLANAEANSTNMQQFWQQEKECYGITEDVLGSLFDAMEAAKVDRIYKFRAINKKILTRDPSKIRHT